jgi:hypothetical protein
MLDKVSSEQRVRITARVDLVRVETISEGRNGGSLPPDEALRSMRGQQSKTAQIKIRGKQERIVSRGFEGSAQ